ERTVRPLDPFQSRPQVPEDRVAEARADLAAVHQPTVFPRADMERTKACPRARRVREAADHELARTVALHLHPVPAPAAPVGSRRPLRDDPLETVLARTPEELRPLTLDVLAVADHALVRTPEHVRETRFPLDQRQLRDVPARVT